LKEIIIGLDPGSRHTGFGVIAAEGDTLSHVTHGVIHLKGTWSFSERLRVLHQELHDLFQRIKPTTAVVEKIFFGKNADSAFKLGHARGVCLLTAAEHAARVEEYAARYVKKVMTGSGAADKAQVQTMVFNWLKMRPVESAFDATDALSLAVTHGLERESLKYKTRSLEGAP